MSIRPIHMWYRHEILVRSCYQLLPKSQHHLSRNLNAEPPGVGGHVFHVTQSCMDTYLQFITNHETVYCLAVLRNDL